MPQDIERGKTITLDAFFDGPDNASVDPDSPPQVSILDPGGSTVVNLDTPTRIALGHWQYEYPVDIGAELGAWAARWFATLNGVDVTDDDGFTVRPVSGSGSIGFGFQPAIATCSPWSSASTILATFDYPGDSAVLDRTGQIAGDVLYELTGQRWKGRCHDEIRPMAQWRSYEQRGWWPNANGYGLGERGTLGWCSCNRGRETGCAQVPEIKLPGRPVDPTSIVVKIDGANFTHFALHDRRYLVRTDGQGWPCCQNLLLPTTEPNTWSVAYDYGMDPPPGGKLAADLYGYQMALGIDPALASQCDLPKRVQTITRQGITQTILDPMALVQDGQVGLAVVDQWVASVNLGAKRRTATVLVPGRVRSARRIQ